MTQEEYAKLHDFSDAKVGDVVYSVLYGEGKIERNLKKNCFSILVAFVNNFFIWYTVDGKTDINGAPTLFKKHPTITFDIVVEPPAGGKIKICNYNGGSHIEINGQRIKEIDSMCQHKPEPFISIEPNIPLEGKQVIATDLEEAAKVKYKEPEKGWGSPARTPQVSGEGGKYALEPYTQVLINISKTNVPCWVPSIFARYVKYKNKTMCLLIGENELFDPKTIKLYEEDWDFVK